MLKIASEDDEDERYLKVSKFGAFVVEIKLRTRFVLKGEEKAIEYSVRNTKEVEDTQDIEFTVQYQNETIHQDAEEALTLDPGESQKREFVWDTQGLDLGKYDVQISSEEDETNYRMEIKEENILSVDMDLRGEDFEPGEEVVVDYTVVNTGGDEKEQDIEFTVYDNMGKLVHQDVEKNVAVKAGEEYRGEFTWEIVDGESSRYDLIVSSEDDEDSHTINIDGEQTDDKENPSIPGFTSFSLIIGIIVIVGCRFSVKGYTGSSG